MVTLAGTIEESRLNILRLEEGIVGEDFLVSGSGGKEFKNVHDPKPGVADAGASAALAGFNGDALKEIHSPGMPDCRRSFNHEILPAPWGGVMESPNPGRVSH